MSIENFLQNLSARNRSQETIRHYRMVMLSLQSYLDGKPLDQVKSSDIEAFLNSLRTEKRRSHQTISCYLAGIKSYYRWAEEHELIPKSPARRLEYKVPKCVPRSPAKESIDQLLAATADTPTGHRTATMIMLLSGSGLRIAEICSLTISDIDFINDEFRVLGKGSKERTVPLAGLPREMLLQWINRWRPLFTPSCDNVFPSATGGRLSPNRFRQSLRLICRKVGLEQNRYPSGVRRDPITPHKFRHFYATTFIRASGGDVLTLQTILGHDHVTTTQRYCHISDDQRRRSRALQAAIWDAPPTQPYREVGGAIVSGDSTLAHRHNQNTALNSILVPPETPKRAENLIQFPNRA